jgi:hypothetical protein
MKRWTLMVLSLGMTLVFSQSGLMAKGNPRQGDSLGRGNGTGSAHAQNSHGNGQGSVDRDLGKDRATEVGKGKKKGLHKEQYSIGGEHDKNHESNSHKKDKDKVKKQHNDKKDKD